MNRASNTLHHEILNTPKVCLLWPLVNIANFFFLFGLVSSPLPQRFLGNFFANCMANLALFW